MLIVFTIAGTVAHANQTYNYNNQNGQCCPQVSKPAATAQGPCDTCGAIVTGTPASDCCNVAPMGTCGAFCAAGQAAPGWPYNWCDEYWVRPNSNY